MCVCKKAKREYPRTTDTVARIGGDEFAILLQPVKDSPSIAISMERLLAAIAQPLIFKQMELALSASVGAASAPEDGLDPETLLEKADQAMYLMKRKGKKTTRTDYFLLAAIPFNPVCTTSSEIQYLVGASAYVYQNAIQQVESQKRNSYPDQRTKYEGDLEF